MNTEQSAENNCGANNCPVSTPEGKDVRKGAVKRTPFSKYKKVHSNFKSPLQVCESAKVSPAEEVAELVRRREQLDIEIAQLEAEGYRVDELERHIDMLHEYNDIKDIGQSLLGRIDTVLFHKVRHVEPPYFQSSPEHVNVTLALAALRGTTTRDLYSHFGLELDD